ncbi:uncharacterized protein Z518_06436 [Rhinocladiella mackenziei CBS 650.93]|uniref:Uncharacterized protein n=1 Tax=Rhinocladiella mackenziei CBS 650.93 TaxID=1442369 RepID=A0A0D2IIK2_9EURO|nr:uncharacterized protein Z518_06436 [Rhinocladiella mackenziei CBS 650.93]KIX05564.1 hypothetical protein Z518_06436 [Rhinocladiella mackenziei CBS 650.93]
MDERGNIANRTGKDPRSVRGDKDTQSSSPQSTNKCRRLDQEGAGTSIADSGHRFLFVDSSSSGQRPRSDQRAINAHIQQTAHRNRRQAAAAAQRAKISKTANISRYRREIPLQPRQIEIQQPVASQESNPLPPSPPSRSPGVDQDQLDRLRHYSTVRAPEVRQAINAQQEDDRSLVENNSVRSMLTQILQRLDAGNVGHAIQGPPNSNLRSTVLDPFNVSSVTITPSMNAVLRHFSDVMITSVFPTRAQAEVQTRWAFQVAAQEPLVLYSLLAISSAERSARAGELKSGAQETTFTEADLENRTVPDFVSYKLNAIKLANESMRSIETAIKASTIFAMMCLLSIEVITGNQKEIFAHISGIQKLIAWRGGYHGIPSHATELILSSSYMCAAMTRSLPSAPPTSSLAGLPNNLVEEIRQNISPDLKQMGTGLLTADIDTVLDWRISQAFRDMTDVVQYREYYHEKQLQPVATELDYINSKSYQFRYAVLSAPFEPRAPASDKEEACRLALLIFWFCNYQLSQPDSALNRTLTGQLKTALQASDLKGLWGPHFELLTWILLLGAFISAGQKERPWFVLNLARVSRMLRLKDWSEARALLLKFYYLDRIYAKGMQDSWEEAILLAETMEEGLS